MSFTVEQLEAIKTEATSAATVALFYSQSPAITRQEAEGHNAVKDLWAGIAETATNLLEAQR